MTHYYIVWTYETYAKSQKEAIKEALLHLLDNEQDFEVRKIVTACRKENNHEYCNRINKRIQQMGL